MRFIIISSLILLTFGCKHTQHATTSKVLTTNQGGVLPAPDTAAKVVLTEQQEDFLADKFNEAYEAFYVTGSGYDVTPSGREVPPQHEINTCYSAGLGTGRWSYLMSVYYALFNGYTSGYFPNIRECFSFFVSPNTPNVIDGKKPTYPEAYQYCAFMPVDRQGELSTGSQINWTTQVTNAKPLDQSLISANTPLGPMRWIYQNQDEVFKFIMFSGKCGISLASQQKVYDKFFAKAQGLQLGAIQFSENCP